MPASGKSHIVSFEGCLQDPQFLLSKALEERNIFDFITALEMGADPMRIDIISQINIFEKALQTSGCASFVAECLAHGSRYNDMNQFLMKHPINFAADSRDPNIISELLKYKDINVDTIYSKLTPLNSLAKNINNENFQNVFNCMKLLIDFGANPNISDQREITPILYVINNKELHNNQKFEIIKYFIENTEVDLESYRNGEAKEKLKIQFPELQLNELKNEESMNNDILMSLLKNRNENKFIKEFNKFQLNSSEKDNQQNLTQENNLSLLIEAISKGLQESIKIILKCGVNINLSKQGKNPFEVACVYGNWEALKMLIEYDESGLYISDNLLIYIIKKLDEISEENFCDYYKCFYILLNSEKLNINDIDKSGSTPLHYAVKYKNNIAIKELLKRGAYIGTKSIFKDLPISDIDSNILEEHFDNCVTTNQCKPGDDNFEIIFNYSNLIPNYNKKKNQNGSWCNRQEMLPIEYIAQSNDMRYLLKHPLITSFLFLKWHRLSLIFYLNFLLYSIFCGSIVTFIIIDFNNINNEELLKTFKILSYCGVIYMIFRELIQFFISPKMFLTTIVNYFEILVITLSIVTLCSPDYEKETQRVFAVFTILLASIELCLLVGSLPVPSISTHMLMLQAVSTSFLKSFGLYSIFVITFSLCFYILFGKEDEKLSKNVNDADDGEFNKFVNPFAAVIKTIVMLTGEFDAGDIDFNSFVSYFVFLLFVVFMSIVLFNLLNGLAVNDTQAIKSQAELNSYICRTNLLSSYEKVLTGRDWISGLLFGCQYFRTILENITTIFPNYIPAKYIIIMPNDKNRIYVPMIRNKSNEEILLKKKISSKENYDSEKNLLERPIKGLCCSILAGKCSEMDVRTVKVAIRLLEKKSRELELENKLRSKEERFDQIEKKLNHVMKLLQEIHSK